MSESSQPQHESHTPGSHYQPSLAVVLVILILFVGATFLMLHSSGTTKKTPTSSTTTTMQIGTPSSTTRVVARAKVRVQVANGTSIPGLAGTVTQTLTTLRWDTLPATNGPHVSATIVYFTPGYKWAAQEIAAAINVSSSAVQALNGASPVTGSSTDDVVVVLGPDASATG